MKIKEKYKNIDIIDECLEKENQLHSDNINQTDLKKFLKEMKKAKENEYFDIYVVLYLLIKKYNNYKKKLSIISKTNGILDNIYVQTWLFVPYRKLEYIKFRLIDKNIEETDIILKCEKSKNIIDLLNEFCEDWKDTFVIEEY